MYLTDTGHAAIGYNKQQGMQEGNYARSMTFLPFLQAT